MRRNLQLLLVERLVILRGGHANRVMIRIDGLDQHDARQIAAARASGHLREQLERALGGAKIRQAQSDIRRHHAHQRHVGNVVPLGDHLRADQDVEIALAESLQDDFVLPLAGDGVAIQARDARAGKLAVQFLLHFFRTHAEKVDVLALALRAYRRNAFGVTAVVAQQAAVAAMKGQRD